MPIACRLMAWIGVLMTVVLGHGEAFAQNLEALDRQISAIDEQIRQIEQNSIRTLRDQVDAQRRVVRDKQREADQMRDAIKDVDTNIKGLQRQRRQLADKLAILNTSMVDIQLAIRDYENATSNEEEIAAFRRLFQMINGPSRQPDITTLNQRDLQFQILRKKAVNDLVSVLGSALVGIGGIVVQFVSLFAPSPPSLPGSISGKFVGQLDSLFGKGALDREAGAIADELDRIRRTQQFGNPEGRNAAIAEAEKMDDLAARRISNLQPFLASMEAEAQPVEDELQKAKDELKTAQDALREREAERAALQRQREDLFQQTLVARVRELNRQNTGRKFVTGVSIQGRFRSLAADDMSAAILDIPRSMPVVVPSSMLVEVQGQCEVCQRTESGNDVCRTHNFTTYRSLSFPQTENPNFSQTGEGSVSFGNNRFSGQRAGRVEVTIGKGPGAARVERLQHPCGPHSRIVTGPARTTSTSIDVNAVKDLRMKALQLFDGQDRMDLFLQEDFGTNLQNGQIAVAATRISGGRETEFFVNRGIDVSSNAAQAFTVNFNGSIIGVQAAGVGQGTVVGQVTGSSGQVVETVRFPVTSSRLSSSVVRPNNEERDVPIGGGPAVYSVNVDGAADMSGFEVEWDVSGPGAEFAQFAQRTRFSGKSSRNEISFTDPEARGKEIEVRATLMRDDNVFITSFNFDDSRAMLGVDDMRFVFANTNIGVEALDLFLPRNSPVFGDIVLQIRMPNRQEVDLPTSIVDVQQFGLPIISLRDGLRMNFSQVDGRANAGSTSVGQAVVVAKLNQAEADRAGVVFSNPNIVADIFLTLNRLEVIRRGGGTQEEFVLRSFGPANVGNYDVQWTFQDGSTASSSFSGNETSVSSSLGDLRMVQLFRPGGAEVGRVSVEFDGAPLPAPTMTLRMPNTASPGDAIVIAANIENIRLNDAFDFVCQWQANPAIGTLDNAQTNVAPINGNRAICVNTLRVAEEPGNIGETTPIDVRLQRVIGAGASGG